MKPEEIKEVVGAYKDTGDVKKVQSTGLHVAGDRYVVIRADDRSLYGKKVHQSRASLATTATSNRPLGPGRHYHRQDHTGHPRDPLP